MKFLSLKKLFEKKNIQWAVAVATALIVIFAIRAVWIFPVRYFGTEMQPALSNGDYLIALKTHKFSHGDIVVYCLNDTLPPQIKRYIAGPGDTLLIRNTKLYVNGIEDRTTQTIQRYRILSGKSISGDSANLSTLNKSGFFLADITYNQANSNELKSKTSITPFLSEKKIAERNIYPRTFRYEWTKDDFGPLIVPRKNTEIVLSVKNIKLYKSIIEKYENKHVEIIKNRIFFEGKLLKKYRFEQDYCILLNDDRTNTNDSREIGFIPISSAQGKIWKVLFTSSQEY